MVDPFFYSGLSSFVACKHTKEVRKMRYIEINGCSYYEEQKFAFENEYAQCIGVLRYGEWEQDGSGGEYPGTPCYGWFVEITDIRPLEYFGESQSEVEESFPEYLKKQSFLKLLKENILHG